MTHGRGLVSLIRQVNIRHGREVFTYSGRETFPHIIISLNPIMNLELIKRISLGISSRPKTSRYSSEGILYEREE